MNRTKIDWPGLTHTWNPITGCKRGYSYCYAKGIWDHWFRKRYGVEYSHILVHENRFEQRPPKGCGRIFVGDMSDLEYWPREALIRVLDYCAGYPLTEFMFLTKSARAYRRIYEGLIKWPVNTMQGITVERFDNTDNIDAVYDVCISCPRPFVSWEPMLGPADYPVPDNVELVIVGAMTGRKRVPVKQEWIDSAWKHVPKGKRYFKKSITESLVESL